MTEKRADALRRLAALDTEVRLRRIERARAVCGAFRSDLGPASGADHDARLHAVWVDEQLHREA